MDQEANGRRGGRKKMSSSNKNTATTYFWGTANRSFTAKERKAFNQWKADLYFAGNSVRDCLSPDPSSLTICGDIRSKVNELMEIICEVPTFL